MFHSIPPKIAKHASVTTMDEYGNDEYKVAK